MVHLQCFTHWRKFCNHSVFLVFLLVCLFVCLFLGLLYDNTNLLHLNDKSTGMEAQEADEMKQNQMNYHTLYVTYFIVFLIDMMVMLVIDCISVYTSLNASSVVILFAALMLAVVRLLMGKVVLWETIPWVASYVKYITSIRFENYRLTFASKEHLNRYEKGKYIFVFSDIIFLERLMIFNNVVLPIIAILIILPDCYYNTFFAASNVNASYDYTICEVDYLLFIALTYKIYQINICAQVSSFTSYSPPFIYSYQCSSKIVINYIPVYIIKFIIVGFVFPVYKLVLKLLYNHLLEQSKRDNNSNINENTKMWQRRVMQLTEYFLPEGLKELNENTFNTSEGNRPTAAVTPDHIVKTDGANEKPGNATIGNSSSPVLLFSKIRFIVDLSSYFVIIFSFGVLFPPLILIGSIAIITSTYFEEFVLGRVFYESKRKNYSVQCAKKLEEDCYGIEELFESTILKSVLCISSFLFAYLIFDTWGDEKGWVSALPITLLMALLPISCVFLFQFSRKIFLSFKLAVEAKNQDRFSDRYLSMKIFKKKNCEELMEINDNSNGARCSENGRETISTTNPVHL